MKAFYDLVKYRVSKTSYCSLGILPVRLVGLRQLAYRLIPGHDPRHRQRIQQSRRQLP